MLVWWATGIECVSAIARLERRGELSPHSTTQVLGRLDALSESWNEIQPLEGVRRTARRLLRVHDLRTADSLQLASAIVATEGQPVSLPFVSLDGRLVEAAEREGFAVIEPAAE